MKAVGRQVIAATILMGIAILSGPLVAGANEADAAIVNREAPVVSVAQATRREIVARVPVTGTLVARQPVQIHAQVAGYEIREIRAEIGDKVAKGDILALLDDETLTVQLAQADAEYTRAAASVRQAESQIASAEAMLRQAQSQLERTLSLRKTGNAAQSLLDEVIATEASARASAASAADGLAVAKAQLAQSEAARDLARLHLRHTRIVAPVEGVIIARAAEIGALSGGGTPLFDMVARGEIELAADVIGTALTQISAGDAVAVELAGGGTVAGKVRLVPASVDPATRLGLAYISLDEDPRLRVGLFASGWVTTDRREALTVPLTAVLADASGERVQVVHDGVVETRAVKAGLIWDGQREILAGLAPGDLVILRAGVFFRSGDRVRPAPLPEQSVAGGTP